LKVQRGRDRRRTQALAGEYLVCKRRWSAFFQTELDSLLKRLGVDQVVVTGVQTPNCIRGTVWDANSLDYEVSCSSTERGPIRKRSTRQT